MQPACNVSLRFPISGEPKRARLLGPDRDPFLLGLRLSCNLSSRIASREVLRSARKNKKGFLSLSFSFFFEFRKFVEHRWTTWLTSIRIRVAKGNVSAGKINRKEKRGTFVSFFPSFLEGGGEF